MKRQLTQPLRRLVARVVRPLLAALDRRLEALAARLEQHTSNLSADQRTELRRIDDRLTLDVAVVSEHLVGIERIARRVTEKGSEQVLIALPGEPWPSHAGVGAADVVAFARQSNGSWLRSTAGDESTLRISPSSVADA